MQTTSQPKAPSEDIVTIIGKLERMSAEKKQRMLEKMTHTQIREILAYGMIDVFASETDTDLCSIATVDGIRAILRKKIAAHYQWPA